MKIIFYIIFIVFFFINFSFSEEDNYYLILKYKKVNVRFGPGKDYPIKYIYKKKNLPVKIIDKKENFRRIIDFKRNNGWIHISQLKKGKTFILLENKILFNKPTKYSRPLIKIAKGRLLLIKKCKKNWCKIKTQDYFGWLESTNIWGFTN